MFDSIAVSLTRRPWQEWLTLAARLILGGTLLVAGLLKVSHLDASVQSVRLYQLLPFGITSIVGSALPVVEIAVGLLLITGTFTRVSAIAGAGLMLAFIIGIASVWARGISIDCGCFSPGVKVDPGQTQYPLEVARDIGLLLTGLWAAWKPRSPFAVDRWLFGSGDEPVDEIDQTAVDEKEHSR